MRARERQEEKESFDGINAEFIAARDVGDGREVAEATELTPYTSPGVSLPSRRDS